MRWLFSYLRFGETPCWRYLQGYFLTPMAGIAGELLLIEKVDGELLDHGDHLTHPLFGGFAIIRESG